MLIGAWKSFDDLEANLTLDELFELFETMLEKEHEEFRRNMAIQGLEVPSWEEELGESEQEDEPEQTQRESLKERVARRRAVQEGKDPNEAIGKMQAGEGIGYKFIGG